MNTPHRPSTRRAHKPHSNRCADDIRLRLLVAAGRSDPPPQVLHGIAEAIQQCCGHPALKAHRLAWGLTIKHAAAAVAVDGEDLGNVERRWRYWEAGGRINATNQDRLCQVFHCDPVALGLANDYSETGSVGVLPDHNTGSTSPRAVAGDQAPKAYAAPVNAGTLHTVQPVGDLSIEGYILMTARESGEYADHPTNVGEVTLDLLRGELVRVARSFANAPRLEVFTAARRLRDWAFSLLDDRHRAAESRDLYFTAAVACGILADSTALDFGLYAAGMAHARTAWLLAEQAAHSDLRAWVRVRQALMAYNNGRPAQALELARRGQEYNLNGTLSVWLPALEARAASALRDTEATRAALVRASKARELSRPNDLDALGGIMTFSVAKQHYYDTESYLGIGDNAKVAAEADACIAAYRSGDEQDRAYDNEAITLVQAATAHVINGDLDAAHDTVQPALRIAPELRVATLDERFRRLTRQLTSPHVREAGLAIELRDQVETFLAAPGPALPG